MSGHDVAGALTRRASGSPAATTTLVRAPGSARKDTGSGDVSMPVRRAAAGAAPHVSTVAAPLRIEVGRLMLDGVALSLRQQERLLPVIEGELARLHRAARHDDAPQAGAREHANVQTLPFAAMDSVVTLGIGIARCLHAGLRERGTDA